MLRSSVPVRPVLVEAKTMKPSAKLANAPLMPVALNSPAAKVKEGRERGPSVLETLRKQEEAQELAANTAKRSRSIAATVARGAVQVRTDLPNGVGVLGRGRAARNVALDSDGSCLPGMMARKQTLLEKVGSRPISAMVAIAPAGLGSLDAMPDRDDYPAGEAGNVAFDADWAKYTDKHCSRRAGQTRSEDQHELKAGWFGYWHERRGNGKCVEWMQKDNGYELQLVEVDGLPVVPRVGSICEFVSLMAKGSKGKCPKGGWAEYRSGPWYKMRFGHEQGDFLRADNEKEFGHGAYADQPCRFTTIEQKLSGMRLWYDDKLKHTSIANPFRNQRLLDLMASLEKQMGRAVAHKPKMLKPATLKATQGEVDLDDADEVGMVLYASNNTIKGDRAADEYNCDWSDVGFHEKTTERASAATYRKQATKNNKKQVDVPPKVIHCTLACKGKVERTEDGKLELKTFCPMHLAMHLRTLQARDAGIEVEALKGPVFGKYRRVKDVPAGATLRRLATGSVSCQAGRLVCVVTWEQECQGMMYDRSHPFVVNGKMFWPAPRGLWVEKEGGYAVFAWATANGVTHRFRKQLRLTNRRAGKEVISEAEIAQSSSKTFRITMATLLARYGVPMAEIVEMGEWEDEEMARRYIELQDALAPERRNHSELLYGSYAHGKQGSSGVGAEVPPEAPAPPQPEVVPDAPPQPDVESEVVLATPQPAEVVLGAPLQGAMAASPQLELGLVTPPAQVEVAPGFEELFVDPQVLLDALAAPVETEVAVPVAEGSKRKCDDDPQYEPCCKRYKKGTLKDTAIATNVVLSGLLGMHKDAKPEQVWRILCMHDFHTKRREITNFRARQKAKRGCIALLESCS